MCVYVCLYVGVLVEMDRKVEYKMSTDEKLYWKSFRKPILNYNFKNPELTPDHPILFIFEFLDCNHIGDIHRNMSKIIVYQPI